MLRRAIISLGIAIPVLLAAGVAWAYLHDRDKTGPASEAEALETRSARRRVLLEDELVGAALESDHLRSLLDAYAAKSSVYSERERTVALDLLAWRDAEVGDGDALAELVGICDGESARCAILSAETVLVIHEDGTLTTETVESKIEHPCSYARRPSPTVEGAAALIDSMDRPPKRSAYDAPAIAGAELQNLRAWADRARSGAESDHDYVLRLCARIKAYDFDLVASPPDRETVELWDTLTDFCGNISARTDLGLDDAVELIAALPTE